MCLYLDIFEIEKKEEIRKLCTWLSNSHCENSSRKTEFKPLKLRCVQALIAWPPSFKLRP